LKSTVLQLKNLPTWLPRNDLRIHEGALQARTYPFTNHATSNFCAGAAGWMGRKIVGPIMDDNSSADHLIHRKAAGQKQAERKSVVSEQRRQISSMVWMFAVIWIVVCMASLLPQPIPLWM